MRSVFTFIFLFFFLHPLFAHLPASGVAPRFTLNKGQLPRAVLYSADIPQGWLYVEKNGFSYNFLEQAYFKEEAQAAAARVYRGHAFKVHFVNANPRVRVTAKKHLPGYVNYFIGNNPDKWASDVPAFGEVRYQGLFPGIDLSLYSQGTSLKYDYLVAPGSRVSDIRMRYEGVQQLAIRKGRLYIRTAVNEIIEEAPYAYQQVGGVKKEVPCVFTLKDQVVGFRITGAYDPALPLVIDPALIFATYSGARSQLSANCATADAQGNTYMASHQLPAQWQHYPVTPGAYQTERKGDNLTIAKLNSQGTSQLFATYLGGSGTDYALALAVNRQQELVILGHSLSSDFAVTPGAYDPSSNGGQDYVIARLAADGKALLASTYLGGSGMEGGYLSAIPAGLTLDASGNIYIGGSSQSANFPVLNAFQQHKKGGADGVIVKINAELTHLLWSSFLGGEQTDIISDVEVGATGNVVVGGSTGSVAAVVASNDFPVTAKALHKNFQGQKDGFVAVLSESKGLLAASFLGTPQSDLVRFVEVDQFDNVYAAGYTSGTYPITAGTFGTANASGGFFIHKLNASLSRTEFSTHMGNNAAGGYQERVPTAFRVDHCNNIYLSGYSPAAAPVTADALETSRRSLYLCHLTSNATTLTYGSFLGATSFGHVHGANHSFISQAGMLHHIECTLSDKYPVTDQAFAATSNGNNDAAVVKFQFTPLPGVPLKALVDSPPPSCAPYTVRFQNNSQHALSYTWDFNDGSPEAVQRQPEHTFRHPGTYKVRLIAANPASCKGLDTVYTEVVVVPRPAPALPRQALVLCQAEVTLDAGNPGYRYRWSTGAETQRISVSEPGSYTVEVSQGACQMTESIVVTAPLPVEVPNVFTPNKDGKNDVFLIRNLGANARLRVFNRWGTLVYQSDNYQNDWDGRQVGAGTYYYQLEDPGSCITQKGWVEVVK